MIGKGAGDNFTGGYGRHPHIRHTTKVNTGGHGAIPPSPSKANRVRVQIPPNIDDTTGIKKSLQPDRAFPTRIKWIRTTAIHLPIENSIEVTHKNGGDSGIDAARETIKKLATLRVAIGSVKTANTKWFTTGRKLTLNKPTIIIGPRIDKRQRRTVQNNTAARVVRTRRSTRQKARRRKPQRTIS